MIATEIMEVPARISLDSGKEIDCESLYRAQSILQEVLEDLVKAGNPGTKLSTVDLLFKLNSVNDQMLAVIDQLATNKAKTTSN